MSSRGGSVPRDLADMPSSPFRPTVPPAHAVRNRIPRRRSAAAPGRGTSAGTSAILPPTGVPFGEIGREHETDNFDVLSVLSGFSTDAQDEDLETVPFRPQMRDVRMRSHNIKRRVPVAVAEEASTQPSTARAQASTPVTSAPESSVEDRDAQPQGADRMAEARGSDAGVEGTEAAGTAREESSPSPSEIQRFETVEGDAAAS
ncbi:hypothetical protein JCM3774_003955 [Rhodotorula dairenensis]